MNEIFLNPRFPPAAFFHKAMWERQVLWGCERIYSFSQKKIGRHPPPRLTVSSVCLTPEEIDAPKLNGGPQWLRWTGRTNIFNPFPQFRHVSVVSIKTNRGLRSKQALHVTHSSYTHTVYTYSYTHTYKSWCFREFRNGQTQYFSISLASSFIVVLLITTSRVISPIALFLDKDKPLKTERLSIRTQRGLYIFSKNKRHITHGLKVQRGGVCSLDALWRQ